MEGVVDLLWPYNHPTGCTARARHSEMPLCTSPNDECDWGSTSQPYPNLSGPAPAPAAGGQPWKPLSRLKLPTETV
jgi:hypothetical protein